MKLSTTTSSKIRLIIFILLLATTVAVNAVTVSIIVRHYTADNNPARELTNETGGNVPVTSDKLESSVFGIPEKIIVHGNEKAVTLTKDDETFSDIIRMNEHRTVFIKEYTRSGTIDESVIDAYYMEFVYDKPHKLSLDGVGEYETSSVIFVLTGVHHGKMKFESGGELLVAEKLAFDPELLVEITKLLE